MQKTILVTGAASGIGHYIAYQYSLLNNYTVICIDINEICDIKNCILFKADLRNENVVKDLFSKISTIDLAINCAGVSSIRKEFLEFSQNEIIDAWQDNKYCKHNRSCRNEKFRSIWSCKSINYKYN